ncbi:hypothetical protein EJB05_21942, partial [Eragrostis curvula]
MVGPGARDDGMASERGWSSLASERRDILGATELRGPTSFYYHDLKAATNSFSEKSKLGEGGFGDVYKGLLKNGKTVAVKRLIVMETSRAKADFESEVKLISNVHHRNLVRLLGCSRKGSEFLLVYEYMANSSLDKFLFGATLLPSMQSMASYQKRLTHTVLVFVLEIISGRKCNDTRLEPETQYLLEWAWKLYESDNLMGLVDQSLDPEEYKPEEVKRIIEIALLCTQIGCCGKANDVRGDCVVVDKR